jgi:hypothetical protein
MARWTTFQQWNCGCYVIIGHNIGTRYAYYSVMYRHTINERTRVSNEPSLKKAKEAAKKHAKEIGLSLDDLYSPAN